MSATAAMDEKDTVEKGNPGLQLSNIRQQKGYSVEYVASKLNLRVRIIELIEKDDFNSLPEPVFIKGYLRAYSKLLGVSPEPFLALFDTHHVLEKKTERALWQSKRESHKAEYVIRWFTILFAVGVMVAVSVWWQKNRDTQAVLSAKETPAEVSMDQTDTDIKLTDLSKMKSVLSPESQMSLLEKESG